MIETNFLGLTDSEVACKDGATQSFSVLSVPYDGTATYVKGAARGPAAIIEASAHIELYDEELGSEPWLAGVETLAPLGVETLPPEEMVGAVKAAVSAIVESATVEGGTVPVILGGEHGVTVGAVQALKESFPNLSVLQLDAHADLRDTYDGSPYNHACVARRIVEAGCPLVQVGIRSMSAEEGEFLGASPEGIKTIYAREAARETAGASSIDAEVVTDGLTDEVYITVDLDVFDPSVMPSTGTPEPGGLGWYEVLEVLRTVASKKRVVGFDVVELCPIDGVVAPDFMAARLVYKLMGYINR